MSENYPGGHTDRSEPSPVDESIERNGQPLNAEVAEPSQNGIAKANVPVDAEVTELKAKESWEASPLLTPEDIARIRRVIAAREKGRLNNPERFKPLDQLQGNPLDPNRGREIPDQHTQEAIDGLGRAMVVLITWERGPKPEQGQESEERSGRFYKLAAEQGVTDPIQQDLLRDVLEYRVTDYAYALPVVVRDKPGDGSAQQKPPTLTESMQQWPMMNAARDGMDVAMLNRDPALREHFSGSLDLVDYMAIAIVMTADAGIGKHSELTVKSLQSHLLAAPIHPTYLRMMEALAHVIERNGYDGDAWGKRGADLWDRTRPRPLTMELDDVAETMTGKALKAAVELLHATQHDRAFAPNVNDTPEISAEKLRITSLAGKNAGFIDTKRQGHFLNTVRGMEGKDTADGLLPTIEMRGKPPLRNRMAAAILGRPVPHGPRYWVPNEKVIALQTEAAKPETIVEAISRLRVATRDLICIPGVPEKESAAVLKYMELAERLAILADTGRGITGMNPGLDISKALRAAPLVPLAISEASIVAAHETHKNVQAQLNGGPTERQVAELTAQAKGLTNGPAEREQSKAEALAMGDQILEEARANSLLLGRDLSR